MPSDGVPTTAPVPAATGWDTPEPASDALQNRYQSPSNLMTPEEAKAVGLAQARIAGLIGEPTSVFALLTSLEQYLFISSNGAGECCPPVSPLIDDPDQEVWVVAFRGTIRMTLPSSGGKVYDNITFGLDARTGEVIGTDAYADWEMMPYQ